MSAIGKITASILFQSAMIDEAQGNKDRENKEEKEDKPGKSGMYHCYLFNSFLMLHAIRQVSPANKELRIVFLKSMY